MKYKLINSQTGETHLCNKVTIDGFDYYVNDELPKDNDGYWIYIGFNEPLEVVKSNQPQGWFEKLWDKANYKTPIATNNPNIDIPKVVDEIFKLSFDYFVSRDKIDAQSMYDFKNGYNKSQETHPFSDEDMVEFALYVATAPNTPYKTVKELLQLWREQRPKIVYYESN